MICSPSFLSSDFSKLESEIKSISNAKWLHFDVMDGKFVDNKTYNHKMLKKIKKYSNQIFDCHLMIENPEKFYEDYAKNGANIITFHIEATKNVHQLIEKIKKLDVKVGISIKPDTKVETLKPYLKDLDLILIMSVEPGKGGQSFMPSSLDKIAYLNSERKLNKYDYLIEVDGGINLENAKRVKDVGCDIIVVGSFIFNNKNRKAIIEELENV
ncbi:MAG: ribulose-phosphate 3-epimerase [Candidatus Izimaplasma sp.]|nr:ribulose-phosphate 3-epimerase [Candidatus Izimaplasma bacterium]